MTSLEEKTRQYIRDSFTSGGVTSSNVDHLYETADIVRELYPQANQALIIAALSHDIERAYRGEDMIDLLKAEPEGFMSSKFLKLHQDRGAALMTTFLRQQGADEELVSEVADIIRKHELGGSASADILKDADSLSFMRSRALHFVESRRGVVSAEKIGAKLDWMYQRISSDRVRKLAQEGYYLAKAVLPTEDTLDGSV